MATGLEILNEFERGAKVLFDNIRSNKTVNIVELKNYFKLINDVVTTLTSIEFANELNRLEIIDNDEKRDIIKQILNTSPNAPGYDISYNDFITEVKCNIPVEKTSFGAAQKEALEKDVYSLTINPKRGYTPETLSKQFKFLVLLGDGDNDDFKKATNGLITEIEKKQNIIRFSIFDEKLKKNDLQTDVVYLIFINPQKINDYGLEYDKLYYDLDLL